MIALVRSGRTPEELAKEFEPTAQTILNWVAQADRDTGAREDGLTSVERKELRRLRREVKRLSEEREILAKAAAWFGVEAPGPGSTSGPTEPLTAVRSDRPINDTILNSSTLTTLGDGLDRPGFGF